MPRQATPSPWALDVDAALAAYKTNARGLSTEEAHARLLAAGPNDLGVDKGASPVRIFINQFTSPLVLILIGASFISFALGDRTETVIIIAMTFLSGMLAFVQEYRSEKALEHLRGKLLRYATVIRDGKPARIDVRKLVAGDIVEFELGNVIPADVRLLSVEDLEIDESSITGESEPVAKSSDVPRSTPRLPSPKTNSIWRSLERMWYRVRDAGW